jgi:hypothetical protein
MSSQEADMRVAQHEALKSRVSNWTPGRALNEWKNTIYSLQRKTATLQDCNAAPVPPSTINTTYHQQGHDYKTTRRFDQSYTSGTMIDRAIPETLCFLQFVSYV